MANASVLNTGGSQFLINLADNIGHDWWDSARELSGNRPLREARRELFCTREVCKFAKFYNKLVKLCKISEIFNNENPKIFLEFLQISKKIQNLQNAANLLARR